MAAKLDKAVVLYFPTDALGSNVGAHCGDCWKFREKSGGKGICAEVDGEILAAHGVCGLFVNGRDSVEKKLSKELAGYVEIGPTHCGSCEYYTGGSKQSGICKKVSGVVEFHGCCNQWEERDEDDKPKSDAEKSGMRG